MAKLDPTALDLVGLAIKAEEEEEKVDFCCWILASSAPANRETATEWRKESSSVVVRFSSLLLGSATSPVFSSGSL